jgi:hypothetical protein
MNSILITIGILSIIVFLRSTIKIHSFLKERDKEVEHFVFINLFIFKYIKDYKTITEKETGRTGSLYYLWLISINLALLCFILLMVFKH